MGGKVLKIVGIETKRISTRDLFKIFNKIKDYFKEYDIFMTKFYHNKKDHGDLDILIKTNNCNDILNIIQNKIPSKGLFKNDNVISFEFEDFQIDAICINSDIWDIAKIFYSYDPVGNLLGKIAKGFGLRYGIDGLFYLSVGKGSSKKINLSKDPKEIFEFLGYDFNRFLKGFNSKEEIFEYIINGKFFDKSLFDPKNLTNIDRKRSLKRPTYNEFMNYIIDKESNFKFDNKENYLDYIDFYFPGFKNIVIEHKSNDNEKIEINKKFRSILDNYEKGKKIGEIINFYKKSKEYFNEFIKNNNIEFIKDDFDNFYKRYKELDSMIYKEFGFGKKMGNDIYIHKNYENYLPVEILEKNKKLLPDNFEYTIIKWNKNDNSMSFIKSENFDYSNEPIIDDSFKIYNNDIKYRAKPKKDQIYHHKWMFVKPDYNEFDYNESKLRSLKWFKKYKYDSKMIGYKDYWDKLKINENYTKDEIEIANKTSRTSKKPGAVGSNPVILKFVEKYASFDDLILDFGAGKYPLHTFRLREKGYNIISHEFGNNFNSLYHDKNALNYKYDIIYASNVLNVQSSLKMLNETLTTIYNLMKNNSIFIANYPDSPRKMDINYNDFKKILEKYFNVENLGKNVMIMKKNKLSENIDWDWVDEEINPNKSVKFKSKRINRIPEFSLKIPDNMIIHGSMTYDSTKPIEIVDKYNDLYIIRYIDIYGKIVQLGFEEKNLIFENMNENINNNIIKNYETFTMVIKNYDITKPGNVEEEIYNSHGFNIKSNNKKTLPNYIKPYEKNKPY